MKTTLQKMISGIILLTGLSVQAQVSPIFGQANYGGNGCPAGTASIVADTERAAHLLLFDQYLVETGTNGKRLDRKSCNIAIPIQAPAGYQVSVRPRFFIFAQADQQSSVTVSVETFIAGKRGIQIKRSFTGSSNHYELTQDLLSGPIAWTECGQSTILRVNSNLLARGRSSIAQIDPMSLEYQMRRCQ
jgi:hypothetical protein